MRIGYVGGELGVARSAGFVYGYTSPARPVRINKADGRINAELRIITAKNIQDIVV